MTLREPYRSADPSLIWALLDGCVERRGRTIQRSPNLSHLVNPCPADFFVVGMAVEYVHAGWIGATVAWTGSAVPSAVVMPRAKAMRSGRSLELFGPSWGGWVQGLRHGCESRSIRSAVVVTTFARVITPSGCPLASRHHRYTTPGSSVHAPWGSIAIRRACPEVDPACSAPCVDESHLAALPGEEVGR